MLPPLDPLRLWCPDCGKKWDNPYKVTHVCPECLEARQMRIAYLNALYPSADELGLEGQQGDLGHLMIQGIQRQARNGRVIRKSEPMGG